MVTDEERDYMYRVYANDPLARINLGIRRRLAPLLGNNRRRIELMNGLLFSLPGTPVIYYGDEIGMGDNVYLGDRNGVRTPMQWTSDRNAGFSLANRQALFLPVVTDPEYHFEAINVGTQQANPQSLLWWMKRLIALRRRHPAFGRGSLEFLHPDNRKVLAFIRRHEDQLILVVANMSRFSQPAELDLGAYAGLVPVEMFGRVEFPDIGTLPYFLTLGPHAFYWFTLERPLGTRGGGGPEAADIFVDVNAPGGWRELLESRDGSPLPGVLAPWVRRQRWFRGKAHEVVGTSIRDVIWLNVGPPPAPVPPPSVGMSGAVPAPAELPIAPTPPLVDGSTVATDRSLPIVLLDVAYRDIDPETYVVPLAFASAMEAQRLVADGSKPVVARVHEPDRDGLLYDALVDPRFSEVLLKLVGGRRRVRGRSGEIVGSPERDFGKLRGPLSETLVPIIGRGEQSNTSIVLGDRLIMKVVRQLERGLNPELEISRFLTERHFSNTPALAGAAIYRPGSAEPGVIAMLQEFVVHEGDLWARTADRLDEFLDRAVAEPEPPGASDASARSLLRRAAEEPTDLARQMIEPYLDTAWLLGTRTAELHRALASDQVDPLFRPEPITMMDQRSLYQALRTGCRRTFLLVGRNLGRLSEPDQDDARAVLAAEAEIDARFRLLLAGRITGQRIRIHGDFHLGQVLSTGRDLVIVDFEGEPARPLTERRRKRSALVDVAGMVRSFHYAAHGRLQDRASTLLRQEDRANLEPWVAFWYVWAAATFLRGYRQALGDATFVPRSDDEFARVLDAHLLEKAIYELEYELNNRPGWIHLPLRGLADLLGT